MNTLNFILATEEEYLEAGIVPSPYARRWMMDTPTGSKEVILTHIQDYVQSDTYETFVRKMPVGNYLSNESLQWLLPAEEDLDIE